MNNSIEEHAAKFLERDFDQCFQQMRHYDGIAVNLVKFTFTAYTALIGISAGLYQFSKKEGINLVPVAAWILAVGFLVGLVMFCLIVRNRVYYVVVARYINEHRRFFLKHKPLGFQNITRMYVSTHHPQFFNWRSSYSLYIYVVSLLNSILFFSLLFIFAPIYCSVAGGAIMLLLHLASTIAYLVTRENKGVDRAVFGNSTKETD